MSSKSVQQVMFTVPTVTPTNRLTKVIRKRPGRPDRQIPFSFAVKAKPAQRPAKYTPQQLKELFELF